MHVSVVARRKEGRGQGSRLFMFIQRHYERLHIPFTLSLTMKVSSSINLNVFLRLVEESVLLYACASEHGTRSNPKITRTRLTPLSFNHNGSGRS